MPDLKKRKLQLWRKASMHKILNHDMKKYKSCQKADAQGIVESLKIQRQAQIQQTGEAGEFLWFQAP